MKRLLKNPRLRLILGTIIGLFALYYIVTSFSLFSNSRFGVLQNTKAVRQSVNLGPKIEKIKRIDSTRLEDTNNQTNKANPGVFNGDYIPDNSKGLGVQSNQIKQGVVCDDGKELPDLTADACSQNSGVARFLYK
jgi:hypothetical protein